MPAAIYDADVRCPHCTRHFNPADHVPDPETKAFALARLSWHETSAGEYFEVGDELQDRLARNVIRSLVASGEATLDPKAAKAAKAAAEAAKRVASDRLRPGAKRGLPTEGA